MNIILGLDPGTTDVGYALIEVQNNKRSIITYGIIHTPKNEPQPKKLVEIENDLQVIMWQYQVTHVAIEKLFFATNMKTGIEVAQSRWVLLATVAKYDIPIFEYTPLQMKKAICGNGKATKKQIGRAVQLLFWLAEIPTPDDAADAIGMAYIASLHLI